MTLAISDAQRMVNLMDGRIARYVGRGTILEHTFGEVDSVVNSVATVFLGGDVNPSGGFRVPSGIMVQPGDKVRVSIDPRGMRWIDELIRTEGTFDKVSLNPADGLILTGDGTVDPVPGGAGLYLRMNVTGDALEWGALPAAVPASAIVVSETAYGQASAVGVDDTFARGDHSHGTPSLSDNAPSAITPGDFSDAGTGAAPSRDDHKHAMPDFGTGSTTDVASATADGVGTSLARDDHAHGIPDGFITTAKLDSAAKRWRYVPLATMSVVLNAASGNTASQTVELTDIPADTAVAAACTIGVRRSDTGNSSMTAANFDGSTAGVTFTSGVAGRGGFSGVGSPVILGGTNNRQMKWFSTAATDQVWLYVHGYWTLED